MTKLLYVISTISLLAAQMGQYYKMREKRVSRYICSVVISILWGPLFCYYITKEALMELGFVKKESDND